MSIEKRGQNKYRFRAQYKKISYSVNWEGPEEQAKAMHDLFVAEVKAGKYQEQAQKEQEAKEREKRTVEYVWDLYIKSRTLEATTIINYNQSKKKLQNIMDWDIEQITKAQMLEYYLNDPNKTHYDGEYKILSQVFNFAVSLDMIAKNPISFKLKTPRKELFPELLSEDEIRKLIRAIQGYDNAVIRGILLLQISTGARIGEVLGITKECVDMQNHILHIKQQFKVLDENTRQFGLGKTKTRNSVRKVFIPEIARYDLYHLVELAADGDIVFKGHAKNYSRYQKVARHLKQICELAGIRELSTHKLRNLYTTIAHYANMNPMTISKNLGHTTMQMTESYMTKIQTKEQIESKKIDAFFDELPKKFPNAQ